MKAALKATLKAAIRQAVLGSLPLGAVLIGEGSGYEPDTKRYRQQQDFSIWYSE